MNRIEINVMTGEQKTIQLTQAEIDALQSVQPAPVIPSVVTMRQARLALLRVDMLASVDAAIASGDAADRIEWEYVTEVRRDSALVAHMASALSITDELLDQLFNLAATL